MTTPYPIVDKRSLDRVPNRKLFGPRRTRTTEEIPQGHAHHRLVYRVHGEYVLDNSERPLDSAEVVEASHVSLVDVSRDVEVLVDLDIPSKDADTFTVQATFTCTVIDPIAVVREGVPDATAALRAYLKGHGRLFELGLDYALADINEARRKLNAQVKAFVTVCPPAFLGMTAELASVEVRTPEELARFPQSLREEHWQTETDVTRQRGRQTLRRDEVEHEQAIATQVQRHRLDLDADRREYERYQFERHSGAVPADAVSSLVYAHAVGDVTSTELVEQLRQREADRRAEDRADDRQRREWEREDARERREWDREVGRRRWEAYREVRSERALLDRQRLELEHAERLRDREWQREDASHDREDQRRRLNAKLEVVRAVAERGHLDMVNLNLDRLLETVFDVVPEPITAGTGAPDGIEAGPTAAAQAEEDGLDAGVREEDDH